MRNQHALILYPRSYNKRGKEQHHSVLGVTHDGRLVNVKLRLDEKYRNHAAAPKIAEFAREDIKAETPCIASETNSPVNPEGILLFTDVSQEDTDVYVARWAYVLAAHAKKPAPWIGFGRMEVIKASQETQRLKAELSALNERPGTPDPAEVARLQAAIDNPANWAHIGVFYHPKATVSLKARDVNEASITQQLAYLINHYTRDGISGGVLYRIRLADGTVHHEKTREWYARRRANEAAFQRGEDLARDIWTHSLSHQLAKLDPASSVELMPLSRISCGPSGNKYYGEATRHLRLQELYTRDEKVITRAIVIRPQAYQTDPPSYLLGQIQHLDNEVGDAALLTENGFTLRYDNDRLKPEAFGITEDDLVEKPMGLWANGVCIKPARSRPTRAKRDTKVAIEPEHKTVPEAVEPAETTVPATPAVERLDTTQTPADLPEPEVAPPASVVSQDSPDVSDNATEAEPAAAPAAEPEPAVEPEPEPLPRDDAPTPAPAAEEEPTPEEAAHSPEPELTPEPEAPAAAPTAPAVVSLQDADHDAIVVTVPVAADSPLSLDDFAAGTTDDEEEEADLPEPEAEPEPMDEPLEAPMETSAQDEAASSEIDPEPAPPAAAEPPAPAPATKRGMAGFLFGNFNANN